MIRRRFLNDIEVIKDGRDPKAVVRDPAINRAIALPIAERENVLGPTVAVPWSPPPMK